MTKIPFIRFGGLSSVKQKGFDASMPSFHAPPARSGFYAFPESQIETFLLSKSTFDQRRHIKLDPSKVKKDEYGDPVHGYVWKNEDSLKRYTAVLDYDKDYALSEEIYESLRKDNEVMVKDCRPKKFFHTGELWHHLKVPHKEILSMKGSWFLTSYESWRKAFGKRVKLNKIEKTLKGYGFAKDDFEVFIEHLKG